MLEIRSKTSFIILIMSLTLVMLICTSLLSAFSCAAASDNEVLPRLNSLRTPPALLADTKLNVVNKSVELTFNDNESWREVISGILVDGTALDGEKYSVSIGKIIIDRSIFRTSKDYKITVKANGYADAGITQTIGLLCIMGDGVRENTVFTRAELEAMPQVRTVFSATNDFPMDFPVAAEGIPLQALLDHAGITADARLITFMGTDGYWSDFTLEELLQRKRYVFPGRTEVEPLIALKRMERSDDYNDMDTADTPVLCLGQRAATEQTVLTFVKLLQTITVTSDPLQRWEPPVARIIDPLSGKKVETAGGEVSPGTQVFLSGNVKTKIYYTTDGSEPDLDSRIFNLHGCGPMAGQDEPIVIEADTRVKAKAVWPGKLDSETAVFDFTVPEKPGSEPELAITGGVFGLNKEPSGSGLTFADIEDSWAKEDIQVLARRGLITGRSSAAYEPESKITRAEFTVLLVRALGLQEKVLAEGQFTDVAAADWYSGSIAGAMAQNIVCGYKGGIFQPEGCITREEMAVMLGRARYLVGKENYLSVAEQEGILAKFKDKDKISSWARQEIALIVEAGIVEGTAAGEFAPQSELDRAQTAAVLKRFLSYAGLIAD